MNKTCTDIESLQKRLDQCNKENSQLIKQLNEINDKLDQNRKQYQQIIDTIMNIKDNE